MKRLPPIVFLDLVLHMFNTFPGRALHEKALQRRIGDGPMVSSQERRALAVPRINCRLTGCFVPPSVYMGIRWLVLPKSRPGQLSSMPWGGSGTVVSWENRPVGVPSCPAPPRPTAPPCAAPSRPGFGFDKYCLIKIQGGCFPCWGAQTSGHALGTLVSPAAPRLRNSGFPDMPCMKIIYNDK